MKGYLLTIEGPEGSGKSSLIQSLVASLHAESFPVMLTKEPGGTPLGQLIREWSVHGQELAPWTALLLFLADRTQHLHEVLMPAL